MDKYQQLIQIRTHKLAVQLRDARIARRRSEEECASAMGISMDVYHSYEVARSAPSLPELEALAFFLDIHLEQFWGNQLISETIKASRIEQPESLHQIRNRFISTRLHMARSQAGFELATLAEATGIPEETLKQYEMGRSSIPLPDLEIITSKFNLPMLSLLDKDGPIGQWRKGQEFLQKILDLPDELQNFIILPVNQPYLRLAARLSELSVDRLRAVAEGLLEITY